MIKIGSNGQKIAYGIKHFNVDTEEDLKDLPTVHGTMGSTCFVIATSKHYMLNGQLQWVEVTPYGKVISSGSGDIDGDGIPDDIDPSIDITPDGGEVDSSNDTIYEGGDI